MEISAYIRNHASEHDVRVCTAGNVQQFEVAAKPNAHGSLLNGGKLLIAALAICYCNDLYREGARIGIEVNGCEVVAAARFNGIGLGSESVVYHARVESSATPEQIDHLLAETDRLAEVHNTLRSGCSVQRMAWDEPAA
ncbi:OsmC family protein [Pulveribacter suum]|uniref:Osmotically inducible protein OsmC n=1 Tax=Pulveribacter suum TaxID=2116657 RepID=A0A2P1NPG3_9BURK|nr:OsmC family protein [Pulveribacter suum]AVP58886.1 osmotically inducible protein OsmC [Pulveribacter suum]